MFNDHISIGISPIPMHDIFELAAMLNEDDDECIIPEARDVWFRNPATIVFWEDNTKTVVKTRGGEKFDPEKGLAMAILKKLYGNNGSYYEIFKKWCPNE